MKNKNLPKNIKELTENKYNNVKKLLTEDRELIKAVESLRIALVQINAPRLARQKLIFGNFIN